MKSLSTLLRLLSCLCVFTPACAAASGRRAGLTVASTPALPLAAVPAAQVYSFARPTTAAGVAGKVATVAAVLESAGPMAQAQPSAARGAGQALETVLTGQRFAFSGSGAVASGARHERVDPVYAKISAERPGAYRATLAQWLAADYFKIRITGPHGVWESYGVPGGMLGGERGETAALFVAKLEQALRNKTVRIADLKDLEDDYLWPQKIGGDAYAAINATALKRYKAELAPWPAVPGYFKIRVTGPNGVWESYGVPGGALAGGGDKAVALFAAKIEKALNSRRITLDDLKPFEGDYLWPGKIGAHSWIRATPLTRYKAELVPWPSVPGDFKIRVTGPSGVWESYSVLGRSLIQGRDSAAALTAARLEKALNLGRLRLKDLVDLERNYRWHENIQAPK